MKQILFLFLIAYTATAGRIIDCSQYARNVGSNRTDAVLADIATAIGGEEHLLILNDGAWTMSTNRTFATNISWRISPGSTFFVATNQTITINGTVYSDTANSPSTGPGAVVHNGAWLYPGAISSSDVEDIVNTSTTITNASLINPVGMIIPSASTNVPTGWLYCNGDAVSRTTYSDLFTSISTNYGGGDASTTFNVPDMRGLFLRGQDQGRGLDPDAASRTNLVLTGISGDEIGSTQLGDLESHIHGLTFKHTFPVDGGADEAYDAGTGQSDLTDAEGGNETRPVNINVRYYIKY